MYKIYAILTIIAIIIIYALLPYNYSNEASASLMCSKQWEDCKVWRDPVPINKVLHQCLFTWN